MKKIPKILCKMIYFMPAVVVTLFIIILYSPTLSLEKWIMVDFLWASGFILSLNKAWGSCLGIVLAIMLLIFQESLWMPISLTPYLIAIIIYYTLCSILVFRLNKRRVTDKCVIK